MDWSKAKTILIVALLITNMLLGYFVFIGRDIADATLEESFITESEELLKRKNITLDAEFPLVTGELFNLTVEYEILDPTDINERFFEGKGLREAGEGVLEEIYRGNENITLINNKLLIYEVTGDIKGDEVASLEEAEEMALRFIHERGYNTEDMILSYWEEKNNAYFLEFSKKFEDSLIELSFTTFRIEKSGIRKVERTWLNTKEIEQSTIKAVSAPKAVLELLSIEAAHGKTITDISLCYYFDPEKQDYFGDYQQATEGKAIPAWRIQFQDGYKIILDFD